MRPPIQWLTRPGAGTSARAAPGSATCVIVKTSRVSSPGAARRWEVASRYSVAADAGRSGPGAGHRVGPLGLGGDRRRRRARPRAPTSRRVGGSSWPRAAIVQPTATPSAMIEPIPSGPTTAGSRHVSAIDGTRDGPHRDADQERPSVAGSEGPEDQCQPQGRARSAASRRLRGPATASTGAPARASPTVPGPGTRSPTARRSGRPWPAPPSAIVSLPAPSTKSTGSTARCIHRPIGAPRSRRDVGTRTAGRRRRPAPSSSPPVLGSTISARFDP